jgi:hypothetical protein
MSKNMAILDDANVVVNIVVCNDDEPETATLVTYPASNPAYIGGDYVGGFFYTPKPFDSWTRDSGTWKAPTPKPDGDYIWDEASLSWVESGPEKI